MRRALKAEEILLSPKPFGTKIISTVCAYNSTTREAKFYIEVVGDNTEMRKEHVDEHLKCQAVEEISEIEIFQTSTEKSVLAFKYIYFHHDLQGFKIYCFGDKPVASKDFINSSRWAVLTGTELKQTVQDAEKLESSNFVLVDPNRKIVQCCLVRCKFESVNDVHKLLEPVTYQSGRIDPKIVIPLKSDPNWKVIIF